MEINGRLINSTADDNSLLYWSNVATKVDENYQIIFPQSVDFVTFHCKNWFAHWPITLLIVPGIFLSRTAYSTFMEYPGVAYANYPTDTIIMAAVAVVVGLWTLYWGYLAFSRATQRAGFLSFVCYVIATPLAYYLSTLVVGAITKGVAM